ncbi:Uncharacterized protein APZ42_023724 [Daphnia magna]|uniref:Uncharacterized protein n=1 Tax=Daphnia magna TaxID=35525 RepID=A0A164UQA6_9CRUS|nr:Uncharacterized protein APZ42_023724 [Daphnia magna]
MTANIFKFSDLAGQNFNPTCNFQRHPRIASHQSSSKVHSKKRSRSRCVTLNQQKLCKAVLILSEYSSYPERKYKLSLSLKVNQRFYFLNYILIILVSTPFLNNMLATRLQQFVLEVINFASAARRHGKNVANANNIWGRSILWYRVAPEIAQGLGCQKTLHDKVS